MNTLEQWLEEQTRRGRQLYLVLDTDGQLEERTALVSGLGPEQCRNLYAGTPAGSLTAVAPYLLALNHTEHPALQRLFSNPERHWGWLASAASGDLDALTKHWQTLLIRGERPHQRFYRFHDNRVFGRTLAFLAPEQHPAYLGPLTSVCFWQADQWAVIDNPDPGFHPLPLDSGWLDIPVPQTLYDRTLFDNVRRYLVGQHTERLAKLAKHQHIDTWLRQQLDLAREWHWQTPEQLHFLLMQSLELNGDAWPSRWRPQPDETPSTHFERVHREVEYWQGDKP